LAKHIIQWRVWSLALAVVSSGTSADQFIEHKQQRIKQCSAVDNSAYSTGLLFNPRGYATMFHRSECFQELAIEERDPSLCKEVKERKSWFFDGSGISETSCRHLVAKAVEQDKQLAASKDFGLIHRLQSIAVFRNGNGRDFDVLVKTAGSLSGSYELAVLFSRPNENDYIEVFSRIFSYGDTSMSKKVWLERGTLMKKLGTSFAESEWIVKVTFQLRKTQYNRFYYDTIPTEFRSSRVETSVRPAELPLWQPSA
jgi:hypothetical protein